MKRVKPKDYRDTGIIQAIIGIMFVCVGGYFVLFSSNEKLIDFSGIFVGGGLVNFIFGVYHAVNYKNKVRKLIAKANPDTVYEITKNSDDITDELTEKILTAAIEQESKKKMITPKQRKRSAILSIYFGLIVLLIPIFSIIHDGKVDTVTFFFIGFTDFLFAFGVYILATLRKHNIEYFRAHRFAEPASPDDNVLEDNLEEYVDDLARQEDAKSLMNTIGFILLTLLLMLIISAFMKTIVFFIIASIILLIAGLYTYHYKSFIQQFLQRLLKLDNFNALLNYMNLYILMIAGIANLILSIFFFWYSFIIYDPFMNSNWASSLLIFFGSFNFVLFVFSTYHFVKLKKAYSKVAV